MDLFVNYDCDLQAANLFERLVRGLSKVVQQAPNPNAPLGGPGSAPQGAAGAVLASHLKPRDAAMGALLALIASLDVWAAPLQVRPLDLYSSFICLFVEPCCGSPASLACLPGRLGCRIFSF